MMVCAPVNGWCMLDNTTSSHFIAQLYQYEVKLSIQNWHTLCQRVSFYIYLFERLTDIIIGIRVCTFLHRILIYYRACIRFLLQFSAEERGFIMLIYSQGMHLILIYSTSSHALELKPYHILLNLEEKIVSYF